MSRHSSLAGRRAAPRLAAAAAVAGFRPRLAAVAVATAFSVQPQLAQAQPRGAQVIHGGATVTYSGANAIIRTTNGAGTRHSAINWQSFSVPAGSITRFIQPSATSTSINRVIGDDPSAIYGTVWSNGNLVLVNPHGIAVGAGAVVDTNGFTASTLPMSEADAIAGRMVFQGAGAALTVDGQVLARGGDVVLVGSNVQAGRGAVVQSEGATILAAGERVEVTGRGLEGIRMEVKAGNRAVNLGTLKGDAVGIFADTLRHSGQIEAVSSSTTGGKVLLQGEGDVHVDGGVVAMAGSTGGRIDVLGNRIALEDGALLRASGPAGGGQVRVGGDYQGASAGAPNAKRVYMDAGARIEADATGKGKGGRVIVWSDEVTRMHGHISARGGAQGGDGGFVEVSGKDYLEFTGLADLRAARGRKGTLLLDPEDITIVHEPASTLPPASTNTFPKTDPDNPGGSVFEPSSAAPVTLTDRHINAQLAYSDVRVKTSTTAPVSNAGTGGQITVNADAVISWSTDSSLTLDADKGITMQGTIATTGAGGVHMLARNGNVDVAPTASITASKVKLEALAGDVTFDTLSANPVAFGAAGATLEVYASRDVIGNRIQANGGNGGSFGTGAGGKGGNVHVKFGRDLRVNAVQADGGNGINGDSMPGGNAGHGGDGGTVILERLGGDLVLDGVNVQVNGGSGGSTTVTTGAAGQGGNGGKLILKTPGKIVLQDAAFVAMGGNGGSAPAGSGNPGSMGMVDTMGRAVDVRGFRLDGLWNNTGKVNVGGEAWITGYGTLVNGGELTLASYSDVDVDGGVKNRGLLKVAGTSAGVHLVENTGTVHVAAGAGLDAHGFASNQGVLDIHGVMEVDPGSIACDMACMVSPGTFRNEASGTISGTGTLVVLGGGGTVDNAGKIAPGGVGSVGKLAIEGNLVMQSGSVLHTDLVNKLSHDVLAVSGMATTGGTVEVGHPAGSSIATGDTFAVLQAASLDSTAMPGTTGGQVTASASGSNLVLRATAPVPAPAPAAPTTSQQQAQQQVISQVVTFQQLFDQAADREDEARPIGKDDIVVTDVACAPR